MADFDAAVLTHHFVIPVVHVPLGTGRAERRETLLVTVHSISTVILGRGEAVPGVVHGEANSIFAALKQFRIVLHHAFESAR